MTNRYYYDTKRIGPGSLHNELVRTAEMLVSITRDQGIYYAIALLYDSNYDSARIAALLPILQHTQGAIL
jgi:hypothetical protein